MEKELFKKHGVTVSLVGASLVFGTMFGKCTVEPNLPSAEPDVVELVEEVEPVEEAEEVAEEVVEETEEVVEPTE